MIRKILLCFMSCFLIFMSVHAESIEEDQMIEIFDIEKNNVILRVQMNQTVQHDVDGLMGSIDGVVKQINPIPSHGFIVKIPLERNIMVDNEWLHDLVDEVMIFYSEKDEPYLLVFDQENSSYFFTFKGNAVDLLLKIQ